MVQIPEGAKNFTIIESHRYFKSPRIEHSIGGVDLPKKGNWSFVFASPLSPTEEEASEWVDNRHPHYGYRDYEESEFDINGWLRSTSILSLQSRIRSEGFADPSRVIVLVKQ